MSFDISAIINIKPQRSIGEIVAQVTVEERHFDRLVKTEHPIEFGASITDHAYKMPAEVVIQCGWSDSSMAAVAALFGGSGGYVQSIYDKLLVLQASCVPFDILTGKRAYRNMLMTSLGVTTDAKTERALLVTATCEEALIVQTQATTLPPKENQKNPKVTASPVNGGTKQLKEAVPSPGGAVSSSSWGNNH